MVRVTLRAALVFAMALALSACILALSPFPLTLTQIVARKDLTGMIPAGSGSDYTPYTIRAGMAPATKDFVVLCSGNISDDPPVIILDSDLNLVQAYSASQVLGWGGLFSSQLLVDDGGYVVMSYFGLSVSNLTTVPTVTPTELLSSAIAMPSFSSTYGCDDYINFQASGGILSYVHWKSHWTVTGTNTPIALGGSSSAQYSVLAVFNIQDTNPGQVILVLGSNSTIWLVSIPLIDFYNDTVGVSVGGTVFGYPNTSIPNIDSSSIGFAGNCLVAYSYDTQTLNRYSLTPPFTIIDKLPVSKRATMQKDSYMQAGGFSVTFDPGTLQLTKIANWWN